jgi:cold shock CspA family protein
LDPSAVEINPELANTQLALGDFDAAEATIKHLLGRLIPSERTQKKVFDLLLQLYQRNAERSAAAGGYMKAIEILQMLKNALDGIPSTYIDRQMLLKIIRAKAIAGGCSRNVSAVAYKRQASELEAHFAAALGGGRPGPTELSEDVHGQVVRWIPDRQFGFIAGQNGNEYFFHFSSVISHHDVGDVRVGARVIFNPTNDLKGPRAENVELNNLIQ